MWVDRKHLFIGGEWVTPASNARIDVINATSEESLGSVPEASSRDVDRAITAARRALDSGWRSSAPSERAAALSRFADTLERRAPEIARAVSVQNGMPLSLSEQFEGGYAVALARYYGSLAGELRVEERRRSPLGFDTLVRRDPIGVVGAIVPWNYPVVLTLTKLAPALASGCTIVIKPSPGTVIDGFIPYGDEDEAVAIANDSDYGLGGTVWSKDQERATQIARRVATGTIGVNGYVIDFAAPFGGVKQSGLGREFGHEALAGYQQLKSLYLPGSTG
jgi:acyl-CoA reductase-like NAD-dependent aldehyde dehydrogenase